MLKYSVLALLVFLGACASIPAPGTVTSQQAADRCQTYAYQQAEWGWGALGPGGIIAGMEKAKQTPEYSNCMAQAGFSLKTAE